MKKIFIENKKSYAIVDDEDYEYINSFKWHVSDQGYAKTTQPEINGKRKSPKLIKMHRLILGIDITDQVDHINGNKLDNRKSNLRKCTHQQNQMHKTITKANKSGYKGVHWWTTRKKWRAVLTINGKTFTGGQFDDIHDAAEAYNKLAIKYHGEFAVLNTIKRENN